MTDTDVLVIGGGPSGSTAATWVAQQGFRVRLLERERFPRYHIGESLIPETFGCLSGAESACHASQNARKSFNQQPQFSVRLGTWQALGTVLLRRPQTPTWNADEYTSQFDYVRSQDPLQNLINRYRSYRSRNVSCLT